jgi:hypothetical protein
MDSRWPYRGAQRPSLFVGQPEATDEDAVIACSLHHLGRDGIEPDFGPPEHPEGMSWLHHPPGDIDEPLAR